MMSILINVQVYTARSTRPRQNIDHRCEAARNTEVTEFVRTEFVRRCRSLEHKEPRQSGQS